MKGTTIVAFVLLGLTTLGGLSFLFVRAFPGIVSGGYGGGSSFMPALLVASVGVALCVFGIFLGWVYGRAMHQGRIPPGTLERFRAAIDFERGEKERLEGELRSSLVARASFEDQQESQASRAAAMGETDGKGESELAHLKEESANLKARLSALEGDLRKRKERVADLMTELSIAQAEAEEARIQTDQLKQSFQPPSARLDGLHDGASIKEVLEGVIALEGIRMAIVADDYGLVVETAGLGMPAETLAAISSLMAEIGPRLKDVLPMSDVEMVSLGDDQGLVVETRYFHLLDTRCALSIAREATHPYPNLAQQAIEAITTRVKE
jgi:hypothetical protein